MYLLVAMLFFSITLTSVLLFTEYNKGEKIGEDKMGGTYSTHRDMRNGYEILVGKAEGKNNSGDTGVDGEIILTLILRKLRVRMWS
jgi:hypothetical protein